LDELLWQHSDEADTEVVTYRTGHDEQTRVAFALSSALGLAPVGLLGDTAAMFAQALAVLLVGVTAGPAPNTGCPARDAITAELQRLGTAAAVAAVGSPEVTVQGTRMQVALRGLDGMVSGVREVTVPATCAERARIAAVLTSAWVGAWSAGSFPEPSRPQVASASRAEDSAPAPVVATELAKPAVAAEPGQTPPPPAGPAIASPAAMHLTEAQLADLRSAGASLDAKDMEMADRLGRKGFVGDDFVAAYREHNAVKAAHPELASYGKDMVETIAVARKLGLSEEDEYWFVRNRLQRNRALTQAHNERVPSGRGMVTFGGVTTGAGIVLLAVGLALSSDVTYEIDKGNVTSGWGYAGKAMAITGGASIAAGLSIAILGLYRWTAPLPDDTQDSRTGGKIQSLRPSDPDQRGATPRWALSPSLGPQQAGLGLTAAF
jgi:hypothetical protein